MKAVKLFTLIAAAAGAMLSASCCNDSTPEPTPVYVAPAK
ncbi:hypothetical protein SAMN02745181_0719 [Rubritalea squalenifaciens DSM 18772]|uniref:Lipoprotein n=2 Tax=Rubritalea TaxID=361050 RepID=A0A1M6DE93_9BACT|nr:hypothetical protein SAMN02745181_0719 [Rubritalea squalenifaciens DSM 18772]